MPSETSAPDLTHWISQTFMSPLSDEEGSRLLTIMITAIPVVLVIVVLVIVVPGLVVNWNNYRLRWPGMKKVLRAALALDDEQIAALPDSKLSRYRRAVRTARNLRNGALRDDPALTVSARMLREEEERRETALMEKWKADLEAHKFELFMRVETAREHRRAKNEAAARRALGLRGQAATDEAKTARRSPRA